MMFDDRFLELFRSIKEPLHPPLARRYHSLPDYPFPPGKIISLVKWVWCPSQPSQSSHSHPFPLVQNVPKQSQQVWLPRALLKRCRRTNTKTLGHMCAYKCSVFHVSKIDESLYKHIYIQERKACCTHEVFYFYYYFGYCRRFCTDVPTGIIMSI